MCSKRRAGWGWKRHDFNCGIIPHGYRFRCDFQITPLGNRVRRCDAHSYLFTHSLTATHSCQWDPFSSFVYEYDELIRSSDRCKCIAGGHMYLHIVMEVPKLHDLTSGAVFYASLRREISTGST